jgi:hypothetical protein
VDLSQISTDDLKALQSGDLSKVSTDGLKALQSGPPEPSYLDKVKANITGSLGAVPDAARNLTLGAVRGAGSIGATLLAPIDAGARALGIQNDFIGRDDRRQSMTDATKTLGADPNSFLYKVGKLGAEVAGTAGAGGVLAKGAQGIGMVPEVVNALRTSGFATGATSRSAADALAIRTLSGGLAGAAQVGLASPGDAGTGAALGAALPVALRGLSSLAAGAPINPGRASAVSAARDAGYVVPPTDINPNALNSVLEGLSGKIKTAQAASVKNQPVTNRLAAGDVGLDATQPITRDALAGVRKDAGQAYAAVKNTGTVAADDTFSNALDNIASKYKSAGDAFPGLDKSEVPDMVAALRQKSFTASGAIDAIGVLREKSAQAFASRDTALGKAARDAASALEDQVGRHLEATGQDPALLQAFQDARQKIAKTYSIDKALNPSTGDVSAINLGKQLDKGAPLSGGLKTAADAGLALKESMQPLTRAPNALSPLDYATTLGSAVMSGNPLKAIAAGLAVRPATRALLLSQPYQKFAERSDTLNALAGPYAYRALPSTARK